MKVYVMKQEILKEESEENLRSIKLNDDSGVLVYPTLQGRLTEKPYEVARIITNMRAAAANIEESDRCVCIGEVEDGKYEANGEKSGYNDAKILETVVYNLSNMGTYDSFMSRELRYYFEENNEVLQGEKRGNTGRKKVYIERDIGFTGVNIYFAKAEAFCDKEDALKDAFEKLKERAN